MTLPIQSVYSAPGARFSPVGSGMRKWIASSQAAGAAAMVAGLLWILVAILKLSGPVYWAPSSDVDYLGLLTFSLALLGLMPALLGLHSQQRHRSGRLGAWAFRAAFVGAAAAGIGSLLERGVGPTAGGGLIMLTGFVIYLPGILLLGFGVVLLGVATLRAKVFPRWVGWAIILGLPAQILMDQGGLFLFGLLWIALGWYLFVRSQPAASAAASSA